MSFTPEPEVLRSLDDLATLRALANPVRQRILNHLMTFGAQTASRCAAVVGATPSNCSYHLRELARFGLVERAEAAHDGRERLWRALATGLRMDEDPADPAQRSAELALSHLEIDLSNEVARRALDRWDEQPPEWRQNATVSTYALRLTATELGELAAEIDALLRPYISLTRMDSPEDADVVHVRFDAFRHPDVTP